MNAYLDANADGLGLLLIFGCIAIVMLLIALAVERRMEPRARRGQWQHQARVAAAKRQMTLRSNER